MSNILVVDDNPDVLSTLCGMLRDENHNVFCADSESDAIEIFTREEIELAFIDLRLHSDDPGDISGISLAVIFQYMSPKTEIFFISGYEPSERVRRIMYYADGIKFIKKDMNLSASIKQQIKAHLDSITLVDQQTDLDQIDTTSAKFGIGDRKTLLTISLSNGQPLTVRASGNYVFSTRTERNLRLNVSRFARRTKLARKAEAAGRFQIKEIRKELWGKIFSYNQEILTTFIASLNASSPLSILFEAPRDYLRLPIEFIRMENPPQYLVLKHHVSRFIYGAIPKRQPISPSFLGKIPQLKVLLTASNKQPPIPEVDNEIEVLRHYFNEVFRSVIPIQLTVLTTEMSSYERVRNEIRQSDYDIIHYAGHGQYDFDSPEESSLSFWRGPNKQGVVEQLKATEFDWLFGQSKAKFVFLSSCFGTLNGNDDDFLDLADAIAQAGIPTVLSYRWSVSEDGMAVTLPIAFYKGLFEHGHPEIALWQARREIFEQNCNGMTWLSPVLINQI